MGRWVKKKFGLQFFFFLFFFERRGVEVRGEVGWVPERFELKGSAAVD